MHVLDCSLETARAAAATASLSNPSDRAFLLATWYAELFLLTSCFSSGVISFLGFVSFAFGAALAFAAFLSFALLFAFAFAFAVALFLGAPLAFACLFAAGLTSSAAFAGFLFSLFPSSSSLSSTSCSWPFLFLGGGCMGSCASSPSQSAGANWASHS